MKFKPQQIFRHCVQIIMFFALPGLYILAFSEIKGVYNSLIDGSFSISTTLPGLGALLVLLATTILIGKFFCGWCCAFGTYNEFLHLLSKHLLHFKSFSNSHIDAALKYIKYLIFALLVIFIWSSDSSWISAASPWDAFASLTDFPQMISTYTIGFLLLLFITIGSLFIERFFCRYLCPLGAVFNFISRLSIIKIMLPKEKCGDCKACTNQCSMGIPLYRKYYVQGGECIGCMKCIDACLRNNAQAVLGKQYHNSNLVSAVAVAIFLCFIFLGQVGVKAIGNNLQTNNTPTIESTIVDDNNDLQTDSDTDSHNATSDQNIESDIYDDSDNADSQYTGDTDSQSQKYADGTYTGTGTGFHNRTTTIAVTIEKDIITNIETISSGDDREFYSRAESSIFSDMLDTQSTDVDTVTGATFSSNGIITAVQNALAQAEI